MPKAKTAKQKAAPKATEHKKPGRKPMTEAEKKVAAKKRAEEIKLAESMVPSMTLQYQGADVDLQELTEKAKATFKDQHKRTRITSVEMYFKPEERTAYYVINKSFEGKIDY